MNRESSSSLTQLRREATEIASCAADLLKDLRRTPIDRTSVEHDFPLHLAHKRSHYEMEREFRAVAFDAREDAIDGNELKLRRGMHVQYGLVRRYMQIQELMCKSILTSNSQITIGSNVPKRRDAKQALERLLESQGLAPNVVRIRVSEIPYRPR